MDKCKSVLFLLTSLIALDYNLAQESGDGETGYNSTYSNFPLREIFGWRQSRNLTQELRGDKEATYESDDEDFDGLKSRAVYWIPTLCDSLAERGYTCYSCSEALHCMFNNFALKAVCGGRRPYCNNGVCSDIRGEKCTKHEEPSVHEHDIANENITTNSSVTL